MSEQETDGLDPDRARKIAEECYGDGLAHCRRHAHRRADGPSLHPGDGDAELRARVHDC